MKGIDKAYLYAIVDTYDSYTSGFLRALKQPKAAVAVGHNDILPVYKLIELKKVPL